MLRLLRSVTLQRTIQQTASIKSYSQLRNAKLSQVIVATVSKRNMASAAKGKPNDTLLLAASTGILIAAGAVLYYTNSPSGGNKLQTSDVKPQSKHIVSHEVEEMEKIATETVEDITSIDDAPTVKLPENAPFVIVGGGTTAHAACRAIRESQPNAKILVISDEDVLPYMRPPLSKELWFSNNPENTDKLIFKSWNGKERSVFFEDDSYYTPIEEFDSKGDGAVTVVAKKKVRSINPENHSLQLESGETVSYEKLLIATGGQPKNHPVIANAGKIVSERTTLFRNVSDFRHLNKTLKNKEHVTVVGGGFLGSELACALATHGKTTGLNVTQIYPEEGNMAKVLPRYLSEWTTRKVQKVGVDILSQRNIKDARVVGKKVEIVLDNGDKLMTDHIVVCVGIQPNVELAQSAGLEIDPEQGGFRVNSELEARSDIWVAGDAACFYDINLGRRRVEHHDHAVVSGRLAGENMTGAKKSYKYQSMFWSDLGPEVGYEAIGLVDSSLPTVGIWAKATAKDTPKAAEEATGESIPSERTDDMPTKIPSSDEASIAKETPTVPGDAEEFGKGVVFYMKDKKIAGILLWNIFNQMPIARRLVTEGNNHDNLNEVAKLFHIHE